MIVDMHAHIGDLRSAGSMDKMPITAANLIAWLDREGVDRAAVLPWPACPEAVAFPGLFSELPDVVSQVRETLRHPDRLIAFGNADPRWGGNSPRTDFAPLLDRFVEMGCVGMGEVSANIPFDDPRVVNLFRQCGERGLPVTIESAKPGEGRYGFIDETGSPHLERLLQQAPGTIVIGHGPGFWSEIAADQPQDAEVVYPTGPVAREGSLSRLFRAYPNLHADLSARSGFNAITRDPEFGAAFLNEFQDRLLYGSDMCFAGPMDRLPILRHLVGLRDAGRLGPEAFQKIAGGNALRILRRLAA